MTETDYYRQYKLARQKAATLSLKAGTEIRSLYLKASKQTAAKLRDDFKTGVRNATEKEIGDDLTAGITEIELGAIAAGAGLYILINADYLNDAMPSNSTITKDGIDKLAAAQIKKSAESIYTRNYGTGKAFSARVWDAKEDFDKTIQMIVDEGIRIGRDPAKIAKDIQVYTADGRVALANRWASLERGTFEWIQRLPKNLDWRAVRLVRTELQATLHEDQKLAGMTNPGSTGEYKWILGPNLNHCDDCLALSTQTFTKDNLPDLQHPNDGCLVQPVLRDRETFINDLKNWTNGDASEQTRYLTDWYQTVYAPAQ